MDFQEQLPQAEALENILSDLNKKIDYVINIDVDKENSYGTFNRQTYL